MNNGEKLISINEKAYERLTFARKDDETYSEVIIRLSDATLEGLQRRGAKEIVASDGRRLTVAIEQGKCLGAMSCVALVPSLFSIDVSQLGLFRDRDEPLGMRDVGEGEVDAGTLLLAAESCPYKAIRINDAGTGVEIGP